MSNYVNPLIRYSGSKRIQINELLKYVPTIYNQYYEPFVGGGSMLYKINKEGSVAGDVCKDLIDVYKEVQTDKDKLKIAYEKRWIKFQENRKYYYKVRDRFNSKHNPEDFLFLSRTCVNGLIRFNSKGDFNSPVHNKRPGIKPETLDKIIDDWYEHIKTVTFICADYKTTLKTVKSNDFVYLDPPYFHSKGMYGSKINLNELIDCLNELNKRKVKWMLSCDGIRGTIDHTIKLPEDVYEMHKYVYSGKSGFERLNDDSKINKIYDSVYMNYEV